MSEDISNLVDYVYNMFSEWSVSLLGILAVLLYLVFKVQKSKSYADVDFIDLILDPVSRRVSGSKIRMMLATIVATWAFVFLVLHDKLTEWYMTIYMSIFIFETLGKKFLNQNNSESDKTDDPPIDSQK